MSDSDSGGHSGEVGPEDHDDDSPDTEKDEELVEMRSAYGGRHAASRSEYGEHGRRRGETAGGNDDEETGPSQRDAGWERFLLRFSKVGYDGEIEEALDWASEGAASDATEQSTPADREWEKAMALKILKTQLQRYTRMISSESMDIGLPPCLDLGTNVLDSPIVAHRQSLVHHWSQLSSKLEQHRDFCFCSVMISNVQLSAEVVGLLTRSLRGRAGATLSLANNRLCREGIAMLSAFVENNPALRAICLRGNSIGDANVVACLSRSLKTHPMLLRISLSNCGIGNNVGIISIILETDLKSIDLDGNDIGSPGAARISGYLETNPSIGYLNLDNNKFDDDDAILFARALRKNTNLQEMRIAQNNFTSLGAKSMLTAIFDSSSLNAISDSNHTCSIALLPFHHPMQVRISSINGEFGVSRNRKILIALRAKESMLQYLEDVPVELMPIVLASIQAEEDQRKLVNMIYVTMRWWNMPCLYAHHGRLSSNNSKRKRKSIQ